jgi:hypothetical protein
MNFKDNLDLKEQLFSVIGKEKTYEVLDILENCRTNENGIPFGEIEISFKGSRSRIGRTYIAKALTQLLKKCNYDVSFQKVKENGDIVDEEITTNFIFEALIEPRAKIIIKDYDTIGFNK